MARKMCEECESSPSARDAHGIHLCVECFEKYAAEAQAEYDDEWPLLEMPEGYGS